MQMADEEPPGLWRLRETGQLADWLRGRQSGLVDGTQIGAFLARQESSPWWDLLREALEEYLLETAGAEMPVGHFIEWLAEWGREARRRQSGLLLLTAHRAKGLEFDHVCVLDGGWEETGKGEDRDAPRRLYYVAMTRARETLTLARMGRRHPFLDVLPEAPFCQRREPAILPPLRPELARCYQRLTPADVDLGYLGRHPPDHAIHRAVAGLRTGDALRLARGQGRWTLQDGDRRPVGRLAAAFAPPPGMACVSARVAAIIRRGRGDEGAEFRERVQSERWEVVLPELVFDPAP